MSVLSRTRWLRAAVTVLIGAAPFVAPSAGPAAAADEVSWSVDVAGLGMAEVNVRHAGGVTLADPAFRPSADPDARGYAEYEAASHQIGVLVGRVRGELTADLPAGSAVTVEVRGRTAAGGWSEWRAIVAGGVDLPVPADEVQTRLVLRSAAGGAAPVVRGLRLTAEISAEGAPVRPLAAATYRVYATREGLVGGVTANGHTIKSRDHFVALPSRRGLSSNGSSEYSVKVCNPSNGRCETAPVWDVGPWNTTDDYWNPASVRQNWKDLPQGKPEAQAAYQDGYNGGRDGSGRTVANPAGIDLADGTFWDGLGMSDNGWVNVTYLWTGGGTGASWPTVRSGASGERVRTIQYLLNQRGASLTVDGAFGSLTDSAVRSFQSSKGLGVDGIVGPQTWQALIMTVQQGSSGQAVRAVQSQLTAHGHSTTVDGVFGAGTAASVRAFQTAASIGVDGIVGPQTWQALVS